MLSAPVTNVRGVLNACCVGIAASAFSSPRVGAPTSHDGEAAVAPVLSACAAKSLNSS